MIDEPKRDGEEFISLCFLCDETKDDCSTIILVWYEGKGLLQSDLEHICKDCKWRYILR